MYFLNLKNLPIQVSDSRHWGEQKERETTGGSHMPCGFPFTSCSYHPEKWEQQEEMCGWTPLLASCQLLPTRAPAGTRGTLPQVAQACLLGPEGTLEMRCIWWKHWKGNPAGDSLKKQLLKNIIVSCFPPFNKRKVFCPHCSGSNRCPEHLSSS